MHLLQGCHPCGGNDLNIEAQFLGAVTPQKALGPPRVHCLPGHCPNLLCLCGVFPPHSYAPSLELAPHPSTPCHSQALA